MDQTIDGDNNLVFKNNPLEYYTCETNNIFVEVVPSYVPEKSTPSKNQFYYIYKIKITNFNTFKCKVIQRHWKIKDGNGKIFDIQGSGVVGVQPTIESGESFEYVSFCPLNTPTGNMRGKLQFIDEFGNRFWVSIPVFFLRKPETFIN